MPPCAAWKKPPRSVSAPGKRPLLVTEKLAFHQVFRNCAAVDGDECLVAPCTLPMYEPCSQFLAAAGFSTNVDRRLATRHLLDHGARLANRLGLPKQRAGPHLALRRILPRQIEHRFHEGSQLLQRDRFWHIVESTRLERGNGILHAAVGSDHRHGQVAALFADETNQFQAVAVGQAHVGQAKLVGVFGKEQTRLRHIRSAVGIQPHARKRHVEQFADVVFVVDDEHSSYSR